MPVTTPKHGRPLDIALLGSPESEEILCEAEIPFVYTLRSSFGERLIAYVADETPTTRWVVLAPCSDATLDELRAGRRALREVLTGSWMWLAALRPGHGWETAWAVSEDDLPPEHLPLPGTTLFAEAEAVLAIRAVGEHIGRSSTPASVVAYVADAARKALKGVLEFVQERGGRAVRRTSCARSTTCPSSSSPFAASRSASPRHSTRSKMPPWTGSSSSCAGG